MANIKISDLPPAITPLDAPNTLFEVTVLEAGEEVSRKITLADIASGGGGDVFKVGTPVDNEIGVWTGDGTIEGDTNFQWSGTILALPSGRVRVSLGAVSTPSVAIGADDVGFYGDGVTHTGWVQGGTEFWRFDDLSFQALGIGAGLGEGPLLFNQVPSATAPTLIPGRTDLDTGIGLFAADSLSLIGGGVEQARGVAPASGGLLANNLATGAGLERVLTVSDAGGGNVTKVGTPVDNQVGVWTGDGTIEGTTGFTYDGSDLDITGNITLTGTVDGIDIATDVAANTAKVTNATHTGQVLGATALALDVTAITAQPAAGVLIGADTFIVNDGGVLSEITATQMDVFFGGGGGGDVFKVGTPVDNQIGVWTGDGTIEGDENFLWDGTKLSVLSTAGVIGLDFFSDSNTGTFRTQGSNILRWIMSGWGAGGPTIYLNTTGGENGFSISASNSSLDNRHNVHLANAGGGAVRLEIGAQPFDGTSGASVDFGRRTDTTSGLELRLFRGDDSVIDEITLGGTLTIAPGVNIKAGMPLTIQALSGGGKFDSSHDNVDFNTVFTTTTDWNITGLSGRILQGAETLAFVSEIGGGITIEDEGVPLATVADTLDFVGAGVTASGVGSTKTITIPGAGGGDVFKVGTPVDNQVGVWTGDGTIEGTTGFTYDGSALEVAGTIRVSNAAGPAILDEAATSTNPTLIPNRADPDTGISGNGGDQLFLVAGGVQLLRGTEVPGARQIIITPGIIDNNPALPALAFGDGDSGFYENADDFISVALGGVREFAFGTGSNGFGGIISGAGRILNEATSATNPTLIPFNTDVDSGIGQNATDQVSVIAGGVEGLRLAEASSRIIQTNANHVGLTASVTQTQGGGLALLSSYNEVATVANEGDALTAFAVTEGERLVVINNGANGLQLFPASGDDIGAGVDAAITISANSAAVFLGRDATNWDQLQNQGQNGGAVFQGLGTWRYRTEITSPPATGQVRFNNADPTLATEMFLAETNANGTDVNNFLNLLTAGSIFYIQDKAISANFFLVEISSNTDNGTDRTFGIANIILEGAEPSQNTEVLIVASESGAEQLVFPEFQFFADQLENPNNADWTVNALAPASADSNNAGLTVRLFDDTVEEGVGFTIEVPADATNIVFDFVARAETAPGAVNTVGLDIYNRGIPDNAAVQAWSAATALTDIDIPTNEFFQEDTQTVTLATLGVTAGETTQFELVRTLPGAGTDLTGDWDLLLMKVSFT